MYLRGTPTPAPTRTIRHQRGRTLIHVPDRSGPPVDPVAATTTAAEPSPARQPSHRADAAAPPTPTASGRDSASRSCPRSSNRPRGDASKGPFVARCGHAAAAAAVKLSDALTRSAWPDRPMRAIIASNTPAGACAGARRTQHALQPRRARWRGGPFARLFGGTAGRAGAGRQTAKGSLPARQNRGAPQRKEKKRGRGRHSCARAR
eukprot:366322-Chlamydomonas_euryale.AAC.11